MVGVVVVVDEPEGYKMWFGFALLLVVLPALLSSADSKSARVRLFDERRDSATVSVICDCVRALLGTFIFCLEDRRGVRCGRRSLRVGVTGFSFIGRGAFGRMSEKGDAGLLPRTACRARQLASATNPPGLVGGEVVVEADLREW